MYVLDTPRKQHRTKNYYFFPHQLPHTIFKIHFSCAYFFLCRVCVRVAMVPLQHVCFFKDVDFWRRLKLFRELTFPLIKVEL